MSYLLCKGCLEEIVLTILTAFCVFSISFIFNVVVISFRGVNKVVMVYG